MWQWGIRHLYLEGISHCHVWLPEGISFFKGYWIWNEWDMQPTQHFFYGSVWSPFLMDMFGWRVIHQLLNNPGNHDGDETSFGRYNEAVLISWCDFMLKITWRWWDVYLTWLHDWALRSKVDVLELYPQMFLIVSTMKLGFKWQIDFLEGMSRKAHMPPRHPTILPSYCHATAIQPVMIPRWPYPVTENQHIPDTTHDWIILNICWYLTIRQNIQTSDIYIYNIIFIYYIYIELCWYMTYKYKIYDVYYEFMC